MKLVYLPALSLDALYAKWCRTPLNPLDPRLRGTAAHHPYALTSYWWWRRQPFTWEPGDFIFGDSGGYSARTLDVTIDPREAIRWQVKFCRVGPIVDSPPVRRWSQWRECLHRTVVDTKAALPLYLRALDAGTSFRWWGVVHGRTMDELEQWWTAISRVYPFTGEGEGWAFKPYPENTPEGMATVLAFIQQRGIRRAHFFATTGRYAVETLCCLGPQRGLEVATVDRFSARKMANNYRLLVRGRHWHSAVEKAAGRPYMIDRCQCGSCDLLRRDLADHAHLLDEGYWKYRLYFHNVLVLRDEFEAMRNLYAKPVSDSVVAVPRRHLSIQHVSR